MFTKHVAQLMITQGRQGSIINIISTAGHQGEPRNMGYGTGKGGLLNFTRSVAMELAPHGIRVKSLTLTATDSTEARERALQWGVIWDRPPRVQPSGFTDPRLGAPLQKLPSPKHYARAAVFLASDNVATVTGTDLRVDAGTAGWDVGACSLPVRAGWSLEGGHRRAGLCRGHHREVISRQEVVSADHLDLSDKE